MTAQVLPLVRYRTWGLTEKGRAVVSARKLRRSGISVIAVDCPVEELAALLGIPVVDQDELRVALRGRK